jgi:MFS family permease
MRRQEKIKRQNRLFSVGSITFLLFLFVGILLMVLLGLYLDNVIPQKGPYWAIPYTFIFILVIIGVSCMTVGFAIAIRWNPVAHQNYFKTLSKHTKNYFTLSLAHFWWIPLLDFLLGIKMICDRYSHNWSLYMIPVYCSWFISIGLNFILAITVSREQKIEIQHLKNIIGESNNIRIVKKIGRALYVFFIHLLVLAILQLTYFFNSDCANAKIYSSRLLCFTLTLSYICILITTALSLHKYDSVTQHNPTIKASYTLLFIPVFFMLLCWTFLFPVIIKHIVYILLGSPTPVPMDFFQFARFVQVVLTSMCAEVIIIPIFVSTVLFALRLDGYITTHFIWVLRYVP